MNILYAASVRIPTEKASGLAIVRQCIAFADIGHTVTLLIPNRRNPITTDIFEYYGERKAIEVVYYPTFDLVRFGYLGFAVTRAFEMFVVFFILMLRRHNIDLVYSRDQWTLLLPIFFGLRKKMILEMHTRHEDKMTKYVLKRVQKLIAISAGLKNFYEALSGRKDIVVEPSGVELDQFENLPPIIASREAVGLPINKVIFSYVGKYSTMGESKGVDEIIEAFAGVYKVNSELHLFIVGLDDNEILSLTKFAEYTTLPKDAYTFSHLDQKKFAIYLQASDALLMNYPNTEHYAFYMSPTKFFAYLAAGKPIITSDLPSVREIEGVSGVVYTANDDKESYMKSLHYVFDHMAELKKESQGNKMLAAHYSWRARAARLIS